MVLGVPTDGVVAEFEPLAKHAMRHAMRHPDLYLMPRLMRTNAALNAPFSHAPKPAIRCRTYTPWGYTTKRVGKQLGPRYACKRTA
jgi:hypothetical protein